MFDDQNLTLLVAVMGVLATIASAIAAGLSCFVAWSAHRSSQNEKRELEARELQEARRLVKSTATTIGDESNEVAHWSHHLLEEGAKRFMDSDTNLMQKYSDLGVRLRQRLDKLQEPIVDVLQRKPGSRPEELSRDDCLQLVSVMENKRSAIRIEKNKTLEYVRQMHLEVVNPPKNSVK